MSKHRQRYWAHSDPTDPTTTTAKCVVCAEPYRDAYLCNTCTDKLAVTLGNIPGLADDLEISRTRQAITGGRNGSRSTETPLPWDNRATEAEAALRVELVGLVRDLDPKPIRTITGGPVCATAWLGCNHGSCQTHIDEQSGWPDDTITAMGRWLLGHLPAIRQHPAADAIYASVHAATRAVEWVIDRRPDRWYAGPCNSELPAGHARRHHPRLAVTKGDDLGPRCCRADLYAKPGARHTDCDECGHTHDTRARKQWLLDSAEDVLATATEVARAVTALDRPVTPERLRKWAERGRIVPHGVDWRGHPTYRIGDVLDRMAEDYATVERRSRRAAPSGVLAS